MARRRQPEQVLSTRALNRATLARQLLLERAAIPAEQAVEWLAGMQAQAPLAPYYGLWTRLDGFVADDLARLLIERRVVRVVTMRATIHLLTACDARWLRPLTQPVIERGFRSSPWNRALAGLDIASVLAAGRALLADGPLATAELAARLGERFPAHDPAALAHAVRSHLPLVQLPPRGIWGQGGQPTWATFDAWLGAPPDADASLETLVLRYLAAFGPATVADIQKWCGLTRLREPVERLRDRLVTLRDEQGRELVDLPDAPRPAADTPAPVRYLGEFDNLLLSHADRTRVLSDDAQRRIFSVNGIISSCILVDGVAAGVWRITRERDRALLTVEPFVPLTTADRTALEEEGARLLAFAAPDAAPELRIAPPG